MNNHQLGVCCVAGERIDQMCQAGETLETIAAAYAGCKRGGEVKWGLLPFMLGSLWALLFCVCVGIMVPFLSLVFCS